MTIAMSRHIYSSEDNYIVDDCGWLGVERFSMPCEPETQITECGNPPRNCTITVSRHCMVRGVKARSHQHQWQVLVGDESEECDRLGMDFSVREAFKKK